MVARAILGMAGLAIRRASSLVAESRIRPAARVVAGRALAGEMPGGSVTPMTGLAVARPGNLVVEGCTAPAGRVVAG